MPAKYSTPYELMGGEQKVRELVIRFYELMDSMPEAEQTRKMHPADLTLSIEKLFKFLSGWLGGPSLYIEEYGHPRLRARHLPFAIDDKARDQWLMCMFQAMDDVGIETKIQITLRQQFSQMANHMRNQ